MIPIAVASLFLMYFQVQSAASKSNSPPTSTMNPTDAEIEYMKQSTEGLARQMMMQQLFVEERIRSDGDSGIKQMPAFNRGTKSYLNNIVSPALAGFQENVIAARELSIGSNVFVMNGVEFTLQKTFYKLRMPSKNSTTWHETENIPFPEVPLSVLSKQNISDQIVEMREYFRAFKNQDSTIRSDYSRYFKPLLCYLEGAWMDGTSTTQNPWLGDAKKLEYSVEDGLKSQNSKFYPTKIMSVANGTAYYAHWKTRILCHPIQQELKLSSLYLKDDLAARLSTNKSLYDYSKTPNARFDLSQHPAKHFFADVGYGYTEPRSDRYTVLDAIMEEIPGKDNYPVRIFGGSFGLTTYNAHMTRNQTKMNIGRYHHWYKVGKKGAMGTLVINRGYADRNLYVAATGQTKVAPMSYTTCHRDRHTHKNNCTQFIARYSYALPLEIVWMTPLLSWNPYNIQHYSGNIGKSPANSIFADGRDGKTEAKALDGTNELHFLRTPAGFFSGHNDQRFVNDIHGHAHLVVPSGCQTILRDIPNVGKVRLRYPIVPTHQQGNAVYKEVTALKELVMNMVSNAKYFYKRPEGIHYAGRYKVTEEHYRTSETAKSPPGDHAHDVFLTIEDMAELDKGNTVAVYTSLNNGHQHVLEVYSDIRRINFPHNHFMISLCDGKPACWDGHSNVLYWQR